MSVMQRLKDLDRRAGMYGPQTPEQWRKAAGRWRLMLVASGMQVLVLLVVGGFRLWGLTGAMLLAVWFSFLAGQWKAEHDRLQGRPPTVAGRVAPPGVEAGGRAVRG